jgi:hypothetical protein
MSAGDEETFRGCVGLDELSKRSLPDARLAEQRAHLTVAVSRATNRSI